MTAVRPHDLLRLTRTRGIVPADAPGWVAPALNAAPWVVVRRDGARDGMRDGRIPVGVRGPTRAQRFALEIPAGTVAEVLAPEGLATRRGMESRNLPAFRALHAVASVIEEATHLPWGPTGSVGFELAAGIPAVTATSDLDLMIRSATPPPRAVAERVHHALGRLPARVDCLIETDEGAVALGELVSSAGDVLLRTPAGPRLVPVPWRETG
ncbi:malonate decarboxylase holo-ACP synthase [Streptomyces sp. NBC_00280]|uniref:malonate decarboxylase holo-ACP synthase n=1 Tax=Streptomyces sp. NBC_00280 TaxID=2975699 RepID=UPI00325067FD